MKKMMCVCFVALAVLIMSGGLAQGALVNGDFEADDLGGLGNRVLNAPSSWNSDQDPNVGVYIDFLEEWVGSNSAYLTNAGAIQLACWQNTGIQMVENTSYYIGLAYGSYNNNHTGNVMFYAASDTSSKGTLVYTSPTMTTAASRIWYQDNTWYTCDAANAGKYLTISLEAASNNGNNDFSYDNITLSENTGPTPTVTPTPTPTPVTPTPTPGLCNGNFEDPVLGAPGSFVNIMPTAWVNPTSDVAVFQRPGIFNPPDVYSCYEGAQMLIVNTDARVYQNTRIAMIEGATYTLSLNHTRLFAFLGWDNPGQAQFRAAVDAESRGDEIAFVDLPYTPYNYAIYRPATLTYACDAANAGKFLVVELGGSNAGPTYDNVTLEVETPIVCEVSLADYDPVDYGAPFGVKTKVWDEAGNVVSDTRTLLTGRSGTIKTDGLPDGHYYVAIKTYQHLQRVFEIDKSGTEACVADPSEDVYGGLVPETPGVVLGAGDLHGDNEVFFTSLSIVLKWFGSSGDGYPTE